MLMGLGSLRNRNPGSHQPNTLSNRAHSKGFGILLKFSPMKRLGGEEGRIVGGPTRLLASPFQKYSEKVFDETYI